MTTIGYHASHEQFPPSALLDYVQRAEGAGFEAAMCSDHFNPWSEDQGESGYSFAWLGAALQATNLPMGLVCAPGYRQHPAIVAQAIATLAEIFSDRVWAAFGSGQALNESITGRHWPAKGERNQRLLECVEVMRALWAGETVDRRGFVDVVQAKLHTRPDHPPPSLAAAITAETARWAAGWADGLITIAHPLDELKEVVDAFRNNGAGDKPIYLQMQISYADTDEQALQNAHEQWRTNIFDSPLLTELPSPSHFEAAAQFVEPDDMQGPVRCSSSLEQHIEWIAAYEELGLEAIFLHNVGPNQREFISAFGEEVLPSL
jgi:coenzyme F420-dependent glucose-6-phosphate dehydrogenase